MRLLLQLLTFIGVCAVGRAAPLVTVSVSTDSRSIRNLAGVPLTNGGAYIDGDGAVVQVGYYPEATVGQNFGPNGQMAFYDFVPLIGQGAASGIKLTIGDSVFNFPDRGEVFADGLNIFAETNDIVLPPVGTPLVIRFFNTTSLNSSFWYEALSNNLWLWKAPANPPSEPHIDLWLDDPGLIALSGRSVTAQGTAIKTSLNLPLWPEPSCLLLVIFGGGTILCRRTRNL